MKLRAHKRRVIAAMSSTERVTLILDADVVEALKSRYPRSIEAGIRDELKAAIKAGM